MATLQKKSLVEQTMRTLRLKMPKAAWAATCEDVQCFLSSLETGKNEIWLTPKSLQELVDKLPLQERDLLFRSLIKFGRHLKSGGYHLEQVLDRPKVLAIALTVFLRIGSKILDKPPIVDVENS